MQLWTYDSSNKKLANKVLNVRILKTTFSLPNEESNGNIESSGKVLSLRQRKDCGYGNVVKLQERGERFRNCDASSDSEMWFRSKSDDEGFFTLQNLATGKYLAVDETTKKLIVAGNPSYTHTARKHFWLICIL